MAREKTIIPSDITQARDLEERLLAEVARYGFDEAEQFAIKLALEECFVNAIKHGNRMDRSKSLEIESDITQDQASFRIADQGRGFCPQEVPDPTADENIERPCGRGLMLMRAYMDEVAFNAVGNEVRLVKKRTNR